MSKWNASNTCFGQKRRIEHTSSIAFELWWAPPTDCFCPAQRWSLPAPPSRKDRRGTRASLRWILTQVAVFVWGEDIQQGAGLLKFNCHVTVGQKCKKDHFKTHLQTTEVYGTLNKLLKVIFMRWPLIIKIYVSTEIIFHKVEEVQLRPVE